MNDPLESKGDQELAHHDSSDCGQAADFIRGASLLQEKWVLMIVYSLLSGPIGFSELVRRGNVNTTTMTQRLNLLEAAGVLVKTVHSTMPPRTSYELTESGHALKPILDGIASWSAQYLKETRLEECPAMNE